MSTFRPYGTGISHYNFYYKHFVPTGLLIFPLKFELLIHRASYSHALPQSPLDGAGFGASAKGHKPRRQARTK
ncbi:MAG: hypothetical protein V7641_3154 [Blastocatellia bacterium]